MALTFTAIIDRGRRAWKAGGGLEVRQVDMTTSDVSSDYAGGGFPLQTNANKIGLRRVFAVLEASIRTSAGTHRTLLGSYDSVNGRLKFLKKDAGSGAFDEAVVDVNMVDADIVRMTLVGA